MGKRFTDTDKWKREWFCELPVKAKLVWYYILDHCDHRGVYFRNFKQMSDHVGFKVDQTTFENWFGSKIHLFDEDKYFIPSFVEFQYGKLNPTNNAHKSIITLIEKLGAKEDLIRSSIGAQDKEKDKEIKGGVGEIDWFEQAEIILQARRLYGVSTPEFNQFVGDERLNLLKGLGGKKFLDEIKSDDFGVKRLAKRLKSQHQWNQQSQASA